MLEIVDAMKHSPLRNYAGIPGLTSWLIGEGKKGIVRLLECSRNHQEPVTPHSHRFDFQCFVLVGSARNVLWTESDDGDEYEATSMVYSGMPGKYVKRASRRAKFLHTDRRYFSGDEYGMKANEIHSIFFSKDAKVLFFEGPQKSDSSIILEPVVNGIKVPTFEMRDWMFSSE